MVEYNAIVLLCGEKKFMVWFFNTTPYFSHLLALSLSFSFSVFMKKVVIGMHNAIVEEKRASNTNSNDYVRLRNIKFVTKWPIGAIIHRWMCMSVFVVQQKKNIIERGWGREKMVYKHSEIIQSPYKFSSNNLIHDSWFLYRNQMKLALKTHFRKNGRSQCEERKRKHLSLTLQSHHCECIFGHLDAIPLLNKCECVVYTNVEYGMESI